MIYFGMSYFFVQKRNGHFRDHSYFFAKRREKKMKKGLITKLMASLSTVMASLAVVVTSGLTNSTCYLFLYQPELPEGAEKLRRK